MKRAFAAMKLGLAPKRAFAALAVLAFTAATASASATAPVSVPTTSLVALDRVTPIAMSPGDAIIVRGAVRTSFDGTTFAPSELFDLEAGGFVVTANDGAPRLEPAGVAAPACVAANVPSPCLVPRVVELAHARLATVEEFSRTLNGAVTMDFVAAPPPPPPPLARSTIAGLATGAGVGLAALFALGAAAFARARRRTPIGQVYAAALEARKATRGDMTLAGVRAQIDDLVARAEDLDVARKACLARLEKIDRAGLERRRAAWAASASPDAREPLDWLTAELAESARLGEDLASSIAGLERIAAALRVLALRARSHRGTRARAKTRDPVDALAEELERRDEAIAEAERVA